MSDDCLLRSTVICKNASGGSSEPDCAACAFKSIKKDKQEEYLKSLEVTQSLIPEGLDDAQDSECCAFCKEEKNKPNMYARYQMGHALPKSKKPLIMGFGETDAEIGSFIMVSLPICKRCRDSIHNTYLPIKAALIAAAVYVIVAMIIGIEQENIIPFCIILGAALVAGAVAGAIISGRINKKSAGKVLKLDEIDIIRKLKELGWFSVEFGKIGKKDREQSPIYSKKKSHLKYEAKNNGINEIEC